VTKFSLYAVRVFSFKWEESIAFYRDTLGWPLEYCDDKMGWAQFRLGNAYVGLEKCDPEDKESHELVGRFVGVSLEVENIRDIYQELLSKGVEFTSEPTDQAWGGMLAQIGRASCRERV